MAVDLFSWIPGGRSLRRYLGLVPKQTRARKFLLEMLPRQSIGAEIGVHLGGFSRQISDALDPKELHLIDPWEHLTGADYRKAWYGGRAKDGQQEMDARCAQVCATFATEVTTG